MNLAHSGFLVLWSNILHSRELLRQMLFQKCKIELLFWRVIHKEKKYTYLPTLLEILILIMHFEEISKISLIPFYIEKCSFIKLLYIEISEKIHLCLKYHNKNSISRGSIQMNICFEISIILKFKKMTIYIYIVQC